MAFLADFVKGFADKKVSEMDEEKKRLAEMDEWEKKLLFQQKLEEAATKKKPTGSRLEGSMMVYTNAYGEEVFRRAATEMEIKQGQAAGSELDAKLFENDPQRMRDRAALEERVKRGQLTAAEAQAEAQRANAGESRARTGLIGAQQKILESTGVMPGGRGGSDTFPYRVGSDEATAMGAIDQYANTLDEKIPENYETLKNLDEQLTKAEAIKDPAERAIALKRIAASIPKE